MELFSQPFDGQLGERLIELLETPEYVELNVVVAFARSSGVLRLRESLQRFRKRGGEVTVYVGVDLGGTSYEALTALLSCTDHLHVLHAEGGQTFHPKIYDFVGPAESLIIVGSHNMTGGGLWTNFESSLLTRARTEFGARAPAQEQVDRYLDRLASLGESCRPMRSQLDIDELLETGYVMKEVAELLLRVTAETPAPEKRTRLFASGVRSSLPRLEREATAASLGDTERPSGGGELPQSSRTLSAALELGKGETLWFETKAMTGGSRNILDLSKQSRVIDVSEVGERFSPHDAQFTLGAVEVFGVDPSDTSVSKQITINFDGVDYHRNTILFPRGDKANGTWRLQINGVDKTGSKITDALAAKREGPYLVNKIVAFTNLQDDRYLMSVFPGTYLERFREGSRIVAYNGSAGHSRLLGVLEASNE